MKKKKLQKPIDKKLNKKPKQIISYLSKFRYITVSQFQQLLKHKSPSRIQEWLNELLGNKYIASIKDEKDKTKPVVYCLAQKARHILKSDEDINQNFLLWLYKEKDGEEDFINHNLYLLNTYLYFLKNKEEDSEVFFFNQHELRGYDYFPEKLPDSYIAVETKNGTDRYFLELFDQYRSALGISRFVIRKYIKYSEDGTWKANTDNSSLPSILLVFSNERRKNHIYYYGKAKLQKSFNNDLEVFLTTINKIKFSKNGLDIWQNI